MMKVHIVSRREFFYNSVQDDYSTYIDHIEKVFANKEDAVKYVDEFNQYRRKEDSDEYVYEGEFEIA